MSRLWRSVAVVACIGVLASGVPLDAGESTRVKDLTTLIGVRPTPLVGYGLVVGLNKTGDRRQTLFSAQSVANMLRRFGVVVPADQMRIENVAAVMVTGELPPLGIGKSCRIERAILDKNVRIGDGVIIRARPDVKEHQGENHWVRDGVTIIPKGAVIPSGTEL